MRAMSHAPASLNVVTQRSFVTCRLGRPALPHRLLRSGSARLRLTVNPLYSVAAARPAMAPMAKMRRV